MAKTKEKLVFPYTSVTGFKFHVEVTEWDAVHILDNDGKKWLGGINAAPNGGYHPHATNDHFGDRTPVCSTTFSTRKQAALWLCLHWDAARSTATYV